MAFNGYLVKIGSYTFPNEYILMKTYKAVKKIQDMDSERDGDGKLHRNALSHAPSTCEFQIRPLTNIQFDSIMNNIRNNYTVAKERKATVSVFLPELGEYTTESMYMPDIEPTIIGIKGNTLKYDAITFKFIGY